MERVCESRKQVKLPVCLLCPILNPEFKKKKKDSWNALPRSLKRDFEI